MNMQRLTSVAACFDIAFYTLMEKLHAWYEKDLAEKKKENVEGYWRWNFVRSESKFRSRREQYMEGVIGREKGGVFVTFMQASGE